MPGPLLTSLSIDFETRATVDLRETGVYPYAEHPETGIWCMAWAFDDEEPQVWYPDEVAQVLGERHDPNDCDRQVGDDCELCEAHDTSLERVMDHIKAGGAIRAHNAEFERIIWREIMHRRWGYPNPEMDQWVCSAAEAAAMSLPRSLDQACRATGVTQQKDDEGHKLMLRMTRPRKRHDDGRVEWWNVPERIEKLGAYCAQDVRAEKALSKVLRRLTPLEREHYLEVCRQNDRGIQVDLALVAAAREVADEGIRRANEALEQLTAGQVSKITNNARLTAWLNEQGVEAAGVSKPVVRELLAGELPQIVRDVLQLRADAGRSSIAKLNSLAACACTDGRIRGMVLYHGASTGRETGRLAQVHNFPRPTVKNAERFIEPVMRCAYDEINTIAHPIIVVSSLLRSMLVAAPGHQLMAADYAAIEARVLGVLAGQDDEIELWQSGADVYRHAAAKLYGVRLADVTDAMRTTGKFQILACGYQMGAAKAVTAAKDVYQLELSEEAAKAVVAGYRSTHPEVVAFWAEANRAAMRAVRNPGEEVRFGARENLLCTKRGAYLYLILPAKRPLVYAAPRIVERKVPWSDDDEQPITRPAVEISAMNPVTRQWSRQALYGGLIVENVVQAVSRDIMAEAKLRLEAAGYPVVLTVHDEIVSEVPTGKGTLEEFVTLLETCPQWATGWPIKANGWTGSRYRK